MRIKKIKANSPQEIVDLINNPSLEFLDVIIERIESNLDKKKSRMFDIELPNGDLFQFSLKQEQYESLLTNVLDRFLELEAYEKCTKVKNLLDSIK